MDHTERAVWLNEYLSRRFQESTNLVAINRGHAQELFGLLPENQAFHGYQQEFIYEDTKLEAMVNFFLIKVDLDRLLFSPEALLFVHTEFVLQFFRTLEMELRTVAGIPGQRFDRLRTLLIELNASPQLAALIEAAHEDENHREIVNSVYQLLQRMITVIHDFEPEQTDIPPEN